MKNNQKKLSAKKFPTKGAVGASLRISENNIQKKNKKIPSFPAKNSGVFSLTEAEKKMRDYIISISSFPNQNPNGVISVSKRGAVLYANPAGKEILTKWKNKVPEQIKKLVANIPMSEKQKRCEVTIDENTYYIGLSPVKEMGYINIYLIDITERKITEEKYRALVEITDTGYVILDSHGVAIDANAEYARLTGRPISEVIGKNIFEWTAKYDIAKNIEGFKKCIKQGFIRNFEIDYVDKKGNSIPIEVNANVISSDDDFKIITLCRDITERKRSEEFRIKQEHIMRAIIDNSPLGVHEYALQTDGKLIFTGYNPAANLILGVDHKQFIGKTIETAFPALIKTNIPSEYRKIASTGSHYENVNVSYSQGKISGAFDIVAFQSSPMCVTIFFRDITDRKQTEEKLIENQRILKTEQVISGMGTYVLDITTGQWESSEVLDKIFGIDKNYKKTIDGWANIVHPDDRKMMVDYFANDVLKKHHRFDKEYRILRLKNRETRWVHGFGDLDFGKGGVPTKMLGAIMDVTERKKKEEEILDWAHIPQENPRPILRINKNGIILYKNPSSDSLSKKWKPAIGKKLCDCIWDTVRHYIYSTKQIELELTINEKMFACLLVPVLKRNYLNLYFLDITEHKKTEGEILLKNALLSAQNEASIDGILAVDTSGKMISHNLRFEQMWKIPNSIMCTGDDKKMLSCAIKQLKQPDVFLKQVQQLYKETTKINNDEFELKDGRIFSRYTSPLIDAAGKHLGRIWFFRDITEAKNSERTIKASEERFRGIFDSSRDAIITMEPPTWALTSANPAAVSMFACTNQEEFIGKNPDKCSPTFQPDGKSSHDGIKTMIEKTMKEGSALFEWTNRRITGEEFPTSILFNRVTVGGKTFLQATIRDITRQKKIEQAKMELISLASHQLRTPPTGVKWYTNMLLSQDVGKINKRQRTYLNEIMHNNQKMIDLVHSLLNASKLELGKFTPKLARTAIAKVIDDVLAELTPQIINKKLRIIKHYENNLYAMVDPSHLRIIVLNIINNAVQYTSNNDEIKITLKKNGHFVSITVSDTGCGIPANQQSQIFSQFFRADNAIDKQKNGSGLGLYIVKLLVNSMGGSIEFTSKLKKGTTFFLSIPVKSKIKNIF